MRIRTILFAGLLCSILAACGSDAGDVLGVNNPKFRFIHAAPEGPEVTLAQNGTTLLAPSRKYLFAEKFREINDANHTFAVQEAKTAQWLGATAFKAGKGHRYSMILMPDTPQLGVLSLDDPYEKGLLEDRARLRGVNAVPGSDRFDVYVTPAGTDLQSLTPTLASIAYKSAVPAAGQDAHYLNGGQYQVRLTAAGSKEELFRSQTLEIGNKSDLMLLVIPGKATAGIQPTSPKPRMLLVRANDEDQRAIELDDNRP